MEKVIKFESQSFGKRLKSMLKVDFRRMFTMRLFYIMVGVCLVIPILILVMTTMLDGSVSVDPNTGAETVVEGFDNTWQIIGSASGEGSAASMDMIGMCNINLLMSVIAKQKTWMSMVGSFCISMLFFMMIPMLTPLDSGIVNVIGCLAGGVLFSIGFGAVSNQVLRKTSLV